VGETKSSWAAFHSSEQRECSECHGMEFDIDWKHRQKICKKCGAIYGMKRNH
jgi:acetyl-CoA carboxylase beta subunit